MSSKLDNQASAPRATRERASGKTRSKNGGLKAQLQRKSASRRSKNATETRIDAACSRPRRNDLQPTMRTVWMPVGELHASSKRARVTTPEILETVINSVTQSGFLQAILIDGGGRIVAGHVLWEAAKRLGLSTIECRVVDHLDPIEMEAATLALNRIDETGKWDIEILRERMIEIQSAGIELTSTGFTLPEIDQILLQPSSPSETESGELDEEENDEAIVSREDDLFLLGNHRLLCGDALAEANYAKVLDGRLAHAVFSDPPYNCPIEGFVSGLGKHKHPNFKMVNGDLGDEAFTTFLRTYLRHCKDATSQGAVIFACMDHRQIDKLCLAGSGAGLTRNNIVVWNKGAGGMTGSVYRSQHELIAVFVNGDKPATNNVALGAHGRDRTNVWSYPGANRKGSSAAAALADHPTPKSVPLVEDALLDVTIVGDVVLDPFSGSGTTIIAAEGTGRIACAIELDPIYVDRSIRRWERLTGQEAVHLETGLTFAELQEHRTNADDV